MILKDLLPAVAFRCRVHLNLFDRRMTLYKQYISYAEDILIENIWLNREVLFMSIVKVEYDQNHDQMIYFSRSLRNQNSDTEKT